MGLKVSFIITNAFFVKLECFGVSLLHMLYLSEDKIKLAS